MCRKRASDAEGSRSDWSAALCWLASVIFAAICARRYLVSRAADQSLREPSASDERFRDIDTPQQPMLRMGDDGPLGNRDNTLQVPSPSTTQPLERFACDAGDQQPGVGPTIGVHAIDSPEALREALQARVREDAASARALGDLVRALYLDESNFRFHAIADLPQDDASLARALIAQWLANPAAVDYWEGLYATLPQRPDAVPAPEQASQLSR